jgi:hypothetical protein
MRRVWEILRFLAGFGQESSARRRYEFADEPRGAPPQRAPLLDSYPPRRVQGSYWHPDIPLSPYEAVNLLEALKVVKDTGDWHGQLRSRCQEVLRVYGDDRPPNASAEDMRA